jgi:hypothetical protein
MPVNGKRARVSEGWIGGSNEDAPCTYMNTMLGLSYYGKDVLGPFRSRDGRLYFVRTPSSSHLPSYPSSSFSSSSSFPPFLHPKLILYSPSSQSRPIPPPREHVRHQRRARDHDRHLCSSRLLNVVQAPVRAVLYRAGRGGTGADTDAGCCRGGVGGGRWPREGEEEI